MIWAGDEGGRYESEAVYGGKNFGMLREAEVSLAQDKKVREVCRSLWGIDCPEKNQDFGNKAKEITSSLVFAKVVEVDLVTVDRYGRTVAFVKVGDTVVAEELMRQGLARVFIRYRDREICQE
jgi:micrococcal nuclease